jgi:NADH dehydrogenase FAD-containing subunit
MLGQRPLSEKMYDLPSNGIRGGPTGIEFGAELQDLINDDLKQIYPKLMNFVKITVYDVAPKVLPMFDKSLAEYALETFSRESIKVKTQHHVEELRPDPAEEGSLLLRIKEEPKGEIGAGIVVWSTGLMQNPFVQRLTSQPIPKHASSWNDCKEREFKIKPDPKTGGITTNTHLRVQLCPGPTPTEAPDAGQNILPDIFALGDCAVIENVVHPATAQVANQKAVWLAKRLNKSDWAQQSFQYKNLGTMTYLGNWKAISQTGSSNEIKGWAAWVLWRGAYLAMSVSWRNKILIPVYWAVNWLLGRDISRF